MRGFPADHPAGRVRFALPDDDARATVADDCDMTTQRLTLKLDGVTAGDYLAYIRDPEPPALGHALRSISVTADPFGSIVEATIEWDGPAPEAHAAARAAGLPVTGDVRAVRSRVPLRRRHTDNYGVPQAFRGRVPVPAVFA